MKNAMKLVMPDGPPQDSQPNETEGETAAQEQSENEATEGSPEQEAQTFYDELMADDPKVCHALYELLKAKYEEEDKTTKKEVNKEKASSSKVDEDYNTEDMPKD